MMRESLGSRLTAVAAVAAETARQRAAGTLVQRAAETFADSDIDVAIGDDGDVRLRGAGLLVRAFGGRKRASDPRFAGLLATLARGDRR
jgi:hypothetical protein